MLIHKFKPRSKLFLVWLSVVLGILCGASLTLASSLTVIGAEKAGNSAQTIPPYSSEPVPIPDGWNEGEHYLNPFPEDAPLYTIDAGSMARHKAYLTPGQMALLKQHTQRKLPIYISRRSARFPDSILNATAANTNKVTLSEKGTGLINYVEGFPFPRLSNDAQEAALQGMWNHLTRYRGHHVERTVIQATVFENGDFQPIKIHQRFQRALRTQEDIADNILFYYIDRVVAPSRLAGTTLLVHETLDQTREKRLAWLYSHAERRVRRLPGAEYDTPIPTTSGIKIADAHDMYNGAPDKYHWTYHGKQELYIPYNAYALSDPQQSYENILRAGSINSSLMRWEIHRVHKIEANLKEGERHIYGRRVFYLDEDSWSIVLSESYDQRGELWRVAEGHLINYYDRPLPFYAVEVIYDLVTARYVVFGLSNEEHRSYSFDKEFSRANFTPSALRRGARG